MGENDSAMTLDASHPNTTLVGMPIDVHRTAKTSEAEDGWTVVGSRKTNSSRRK